MTLDEIKAQCLQFFPVGSRVTCNPAPTDTDADYLALVATDKFTGFENALYTDGFELCGSLVLAQGCEVGAPETFQSYRKGEVNIIATANIDFYNAFMAATSVAKRLNLLDKHDRIALFQAVIYRTACS